MATVTLVQKDLDLDLDFVRVGVAKFFLVQSIGIDKTNTFQLKFFIYHQNCRSHSFGRFVGVRVGVALY